VKTRVLFLAGMHFGAEKIAANGKTEIGNGPEKY
jgi:hypothetical protein